MNIDTILGIVRHCLTFGGGFLVTRGLTDSTQLEAGVGALVTLVGVVWSIIQKAQAAKTLQAAKQ